MNYLGDYEEDDTVYCMFPTSRFSTGAPITLAGTPVISIYKNNSAVQSTAGVTLSVDFDSITGMHNVAIDTSADAFYSRDADYFIVITTGTVEGTSVIGKVVGSFSIGRIADIVWDEILTGNTHNINTSAGKRLREAAGFVLDSGTLQSATANSAVIENAADSTDAFYDHSSIIIVDGEGVGQERIIAEYIGASRTITVTPDWITTPDATSDYEIIPASVHASTNNGGYVDSAIWVDTVNGSSGTVKFVNGTSTRPVDNIADALTLAVDLNIARFFLLPGSTVTLASGFDGYSFEGPGATVNFGGQSISGANFNSLNILGVGTGASQQTLDRCKLTGAVTLSNPFFIACDLANNITLSAAATALHISTCTNSSATATTIDFGAAVANIHLNMSVIGDFAISNMGQAGTDTMEYLGTGELTLNASCVAGTLTLYGDPEFIDNSSTVTVVDRTTIGALDTVIANQGDFNIPKNQAFDDFEFTMVLSSNGRTAAVGKTVTGEMSIDGAGFVPVNGTIAEIGSGVYQIDLTADDTNGDVITYKFSASLSDDTIITVITTFDPAV